MAIVNDSHFSLCQQRQPPVVPGAEKTSVKKERRAASKAIEGN